MKHVLLAGVGVVVLLIFKEVESSPALKQLPSITYDSLKDSEASESVGPIGSVIAGYTAYNALRNLFREPDTSTSYSDAAPVTSYFSPLRVVRNVASNVMGMGKTFANTFSQEFLHHYSTLSNGIKERVMTEAANVVGTMNIPHRDSSEWLEGV